jgi:CelD/BcsL family acetyltransferase involved in cellulose biosynthesis
VTLTTETVREAGALEALAPEWWALFARCATATPFQSPAWLLPWWRHFAPGRLATITVRAQGRLVGLAPFYLEDGAYGRRLLPIGISLSDYLDVLIDPDFADDAGSAIASHAARAELAWDTWEFEELAPHAAALALPPPENSTDTSAEQSACPVLVLAPDGIEACVPAKKRRKLRMARNRAERRGGAVLTRVTEPGLPDYFADLVRLHGARWHDRGESGVLAHDAARRFHEEAIPALVAHGLARLYSLAIAGRVAGVFYGLHHRGRAYAYLGGFDPAFSYESPGTLLMGHAIEAAMREGAREFHFLRGREPYKYDWGAEDRINTKRVIRMAPHV